MITSVSTTANGYVTGGVIPITLAFYPSVDVSGSMALPLNISPSGSAIVSMGVATAVTGLMLNYTVKPGDFTSPDVPLAAGLYDLAVTGYVRDVITAEDTSLILPDAGSGYCVPSATLFVDAAAPVVGVYSVTPSFAKHSTPVSAVLISEPDLSVITLTISGSAAATATSPGSGLYAFTFQTPAAMEQGYVTGVVTSMDARSNAATSSLVMPLFFDNVAPTEPTSATPLSIYSTGGLVEFTLHAPPIPDSGLFGYNYSLLRNGTPYVSGTSFYTSGDAIVSFSSMPSGSYTLEYNAQSNASGYSGLSVTGTPCVVYTTPITGVLTTGASAINSSVPVTALFNYPVTGFDTSKVLMQNMTLSIVSINASGANLVVHPTLPGYVSMQLDAGAFTGVVAGSVTVPMPTQPTNILPFYYDPVCPEAVMSSSLQCTCTRPIPIDVIFSKPVTTPATGSFSVTGGMVTAVSGDALSYTVYVMPASGSTPITGGPYEITIALAASGCVDYAGNQSHAASPISVIYDDRPPTAVSLHGEIT